MLAVDGRLARGTHDGRHAGAARPPGAHRGGRQVQAEATLEKVEGRRLTFTVSVTDERGLVAAGKVTRVIVDVDRFLEKAADAGSLARVNAPPAVAQPPRVAIPPAPASRRRCVRSRPMRPLTFVAVGWRSSPSTSAAEHLDVLPDALGWGLVAVRRVAHVAHDARHRRGRNGAADPARSVAAVPLRDARPGDGREDHATARCRPRLPRAPRLRRPHGLAAGGAGRGD